MGVSLKLQQPSESRCPCSDKRLRTPPEVSREAPKPNYIYNRPTAGSSSHLSWYIVHTVNKMMCNYLTIFIWAIFSWMILFSLKSKVKTDLISEVLYSLSDKKKKSKIKQCNFCHSQTVLALKCFHFKTKNTVFADKSFSSVSETCTITTPGNQDQWPFASTLQMVSWC